MDLDKTSEARRKAQRNGEEDPFIVAQRFLNIYRQIHIFNNEKKQAFNKMLLELSPQIRGMFGQMPGGALLQDYVDELAEQEGIEKSVQTQEIEIANEDVKQAKILATALAEAQVQASTKMQEMGVGIPNINVTQAAAPAAGPAKLSLDKNFAEDFALAMSNVLHQNTENQNAEFAKILNSLGQFQAEAIQSIRQQNETQQAEIKQIAQLLLNKEKETEISETKQLISFLMDNQKQLNEKIDSITISPETIKEQMAMLWHRSEQNMGKLVAFLNEKQRRDSFEVAKMINESQQKLWNMMIQNNTLNQNSGNASANNNIQITSSDYSAVLNNIAEKLGALNSAPQKIELNFPEQAFSEIMKTQSQIYRQIATEQTKELSKIIATVLKETHTTSYQTAQPIITENSLSSTESYSETQLENSTNSVEEEIAAPENDIPVAEEVKKKKKKKKKKKGIAANPLFAPIFTGKRDTDDEYEEDDEEKQQSEPEPQKSETPDIQETYSDGINNGFDFDNIDDNQLTTEFNNLVAPSEEQDFSEFAENEAQDNLEKELTEIFDWDFKDNNNNSENLFSEPIKDIASDWGFTETEVTTPLADTENEGWEWEYVEDQDMVNNNEEETGLSPIAQNSLIKSGDLFFQQKVLPPENIINNNVIKLNKIPIITDSAFDGFNDEDPYKNTVIKD